MPLKDTSKFISLILRHKPETIGIALDEHGWAKVDELIEGINKSKRDNKDDYLTMSILEEIVANDNKQRYSFNEDKTLIRANQGHSIPVDVELEKKTPPDVLYHGTGEKYVASIDRCDNAKILFEKANTTFNIDHHETNEKFGTINIVSTSNQS